MQGLSLHYYNLAEGEESKGRATDFTDAQYIKGIKHALFHAGPILKAISLHHHGQMRSHKKSLARSRRMGNLFK